MNKTLVSLVVIIVFAFPIVANATKCYVDSDCGTGYECSQAGACVAPSSSSGSNSGGETNLIVLVLGCVAIAGVVYFILIPSMKATQQYSGLTPNQSHLHPAASFGFSF